MIYSIHISHQSTVEPRAKRFSFDHVSSRSTRKVKKLVVSQVTQNKSLRAKRTHSISNCLTRTDRCFNNLLCSYIMMSSNAVQAASEFPASKVCLQLKYAFLPSAHCVCHLLNLLRLKRKQLQCKRKAIV